MSNTTRGLIESITTQDLSKKHEHLPHIISYDGFKNFSFYVFKDIIKPKYFSLISLIKSTFKRVVCFIDSRPSISNAIPKISLALSLLPLDKARKILFNKKLILSLSIFSTLVTVSTYVYLSISSNTDNKHASYNTKKFDLSLQSFELDSLEFNRNIDTDSRHISLPASRNSLRKSHMPISLRKSITSLSTPNTKKANLSAPIISKKNANESKKLKASTYSKTKAKIKTNYFSKNKSHFKAQGIISRSLDQRSDMDEIITNNELTIKMVATAYDLSTKSCGKSPWHKAYGITKSGYKATIGRTIAVDPSIIPLKSKVYISFPKEYKYLDGVYVAEDTGSKIKGKRIDVFFGEDNLGEKTVHKQARKFGVQNVLVYILK